MPPDDDDLEAAIAALRKELEAERAERARHVEELRGARRMERGYAESDDPDKARRRRRNKLTRKERRADAKRKK